MTEHPRPRLRANLRIERRRSGDHQTVIVEDPISSRFYRLGEVEYAFAARLEHGAEQALQHANAAFPQTPLGPADARHIVNWLAHEGLLEGIEEAAPRPLRRLPRWLNPLIVRLPLLNPDAWLSRHYRWLRHVLGWPCQVLWWLVVTSALLLAVTEGPRLLQATSGIFYQGNWLALIGVWLVAKLAHELGHGLVCKHFGGQVSEAGVILVLLVPIGYVDATASWRFTRTRERVLVALAGMGTELFLAGIGLWTWALSSDGIVRDIAFNTVVVAGFTTLLFNANPLMRFDGYYALSDLLDIPNLYGRGQRWLGYAVRRYVLGQHVSSDLTHSPRDGFVRLYGVATWLWRTLVIVTLLIAAAQLFHGAGLVLALLAASGVAVTLVQRLRVLWSSLEPGSRLVSGLRGTAVLALLVGAALAIGWQSERSAPAWVDHDGAETVRAPEAGFVVEVAVTPGTRVVAGTPLARLDNPELQLETRLLALELQQAELAERARRSQGELAAAAEQAARVKRLRQRLNGLEQRLGGLSITSPRAGIVDAIDTGALLGRYLDAGDELLRVVDPQAKRIRVSLAERDAAALEPQAAEIRLPHRAALRLAMAEQSPRASRRPDGAPVAIVHGGPLPVQTSTAPGTDRPRYEYLESRIEWAGVLPRDVARTLRAGELGSAHFEGPRITLWRWLYDQTERWLAHLLAAGRG